MLKSVDQARQARDTAKVVLGRVQGIVGIGITRIGDGYGLKINVVDSRCSHKIPASIDGVPVLVDVVGEIRRQIP